MNAVTTAAVAQISKSLFQGKVSGDIYPSLSQFSVSAVGGNAASPVLCDFRLDIGKHFFTKRVVRHWTRLPEGVDNAPGLSLFERFLDNAFNLWSLPEVLWLLDWMIIVGPFQLKCFILFHSILAVTVFSVKRGKKGE